GLRHRGARHRRGGEECEDRDRHAQARLLARRRRGASGQSQRLRPRGTRGRVSTRRATGFVRGARIAIAAALLLAIACAPRRETIVFWQFWPAAVIDPLIASFEKEYPGRKVQMERLTWTGGLDRITAAI